MPDPGLGKLPGVNRRSASARQQRIDRLLSRAVLGNGKRPRTPDTNTRPQHIALFLGLTANAHELRQIGSNELLQFLPWRRKPAIVNPCHEDRHGPRMNRRHQHEVGGHAAWAGSKAQSFSSRMADVIALSGRSMSSIANRQENAKAGRNQLVSLRYTRAEPAEAETCRN